MSLDKYSVLFCIGVAVFLYLLRPRREKKKKKKNDMEYNNDLARLQCNQTLRPFNFFSEEWRETFEFLTF